MKWWKVFEMNELEGQDLREAKGQNEGGERKAFDRLYGWFLVRGTFDYLKSWKMFHLC